MGNVRVRPCFHYENLWAEEVRCGEIVRESWKGMGCGTVTGVLENNRVCAIMLREWNKLQLQKLCRDIRERRDRLDRLGAAKDRLRIGEFDLLCVVFWRVWFRRNRVIHGQLLCPVEIVDWVATFLQNFQQV
ncbi:hypothetical protein ACOSP7_017105 [Xanthoceras sorbifolium]